MLNKSRINKLTEKMKQENIDFFMLGPSPNLKYFLGLSPSKCERFQSLFFNSKGKYFYVSPEIYYEEINEVLEKEVIYLWKDSEGYLKTLKKVMSDYCFNGAKIAVDNSINAVDIINLSKFASVEFFNGNSMIENLRILKNPREIELLIKASELADLVMTKTIDYIEPGLKEHDIKIKIKKEAYKLGIEELAFEPIIASGYNSSKPHYNKCNRKIQDKDIILLDLGVVYQGYCSDISRTVFVGGITKLEKEIYEIVKKANEAAKKIINPGITAERIDNAARKIINKAGYGEFFLNRTGHGIGMSVHEAPYIRGENKLVLKSGMAFSIEPGIYIPGEFGLRIEDIVIVTDEGSKVLNQYNREIIVK